MAWTIETKPKADKAIAALDNQVQKRIREFLDVRLANIANPRSIGEALKGPLGNYWKYRVGDYRIICDIQDNIITILVLSVGDRKDIYRT